MDAAVQDTGVQLVRPLWQCPRHAVLTALWDLKIHSKISCVDLTRYSMRTGSSAQHKMLQSDHQLCKHMPAATQHATLHDSRVTEQQSQHELSPAGELPVETGLSDSDKKFDAEQQLLGHELTAALVPGALTAAEQLLRADLCGEHGEYHTVVFDAPLMQSPLRLEVAGHVMMQTGSSQHMYVAWKAL